jgi:hypothetical protein
MLFVKKFKWQRLYFNISNYFRLEIGEMVFINTNFVNFKKKLWNVF